MDVDYASFAFATFVAKGGAIGHVRVQTPQALSVGVVFAVFIAVGAYLNSPKLYAHPNSNLLLITYIILCAFMCYRFHRGKKFMPAGLIALLSIALLIRIVVNRISAAPQ